MMIDKETATLLVTQFINEHYANEHINSREELAIVSEKTIEKTYGWVFFYNTKKYLKTKIIIDALAGNGPIVIEKTDGHITALGTYKPFDELIKAYEQAQKKSKG